MLSGRLATFAISEKVTACNVRCVCVCVCVSSRDCKGTVLHSRSLTRSMGSGTIEIIY